MSAFFEKSHLAATILHQMCYQIVELFDGCDTHLSGPDLRVGFPITADIPVFGIEANRK